MPDTPAPPNARIPRKRDSAVAMAEMRRILEMPVFDRLDSPESILAASRFFLHPRAFADGRRLLPAQANAILQFAQRFSKDPKAGLFAPMGVGQGKTLTTLSCAAIALSPATFGLRGAASVNRVMLIIPPNLHAQLTRHDLAWARGMIPLPFKVFDLTSSKRVEHAQNKAPGLYLFTYSRLSAQDAEEVISQVDPDIIIADEAHNLANRRAARTERFLRLLKTRERGFVALSGTMTSKTILDYAHLALYTLKNDSPLPMDRNELTYWNAALSPNSQAVGYDPNAVDLDTEDYDLFSPLVDWAAKRDPQAFRAPAGSPPLDTTDVLRTAYSIRRRCCPGVVDSSLEDIGTSLVYDRVISGEYGEKIREGFERMEEEWIAPNGDEIDYALMKYKWGSELTMGYYNDLRWPEEGTTHLAEAQEMHAASQLYHKALREFFQHRAKPGLDTPFLVGDHFRRHGGGIDPDLYALWKPLNEMRHKAKEESWPERYAVPVRLDDFKIRAAVKAVGAWSKDEAGAVWYYHNEVGRWLVEYLRAAFPDRPVIFAPAGADGVILDPLNQAPGCIVVASISAHGTGKNLQRLTQNLFVEGFPSAKIAEQAVGRSHRTGQTADELTMQILMGTEFDTLRLAACLNNAFYCHTTMSRQKMIIGQWAFTPEIVSYHKLKTFSGEIDPLTERQQRELKEKFYV